MAEGNRLELNLEPINTGSESSSKWNFMHWTLPKSEIVFFAQVIIIYAVVITAIVNLTIGHSDSKLWTALLTGHIGYLLPNPSLKK
jgi:hypothetical protein